MDTDNMDSTDPGVITHKWIIENRDRRWNPIEKIRASRYINRKMRNRDKHSDTMKQQFKTAKRIIKSKI